MTSRTTVSPNSMIEWMSARSSVSITSSSHGHVGHGQQLGLGHLPPARRRSRPPMSRLASPMRPLDETIRTGGKRTRAETSGAPNSAERSGLCTAQFLGSASAEHEDDHDLEDRGGDHPDGAEPALGQDADEGGRHQLADEHQQQDRVQERLGVLDQPHQPARRRAGARRERQRLGLARARRGWSRPGPGAPSRRAGPRSRRRGSTSVVPKCPVANTADGHGVAATERPGGSGPAAPARGAPSSRPRRPRRGPSRAGAAGRARPAAPPRRRRLTRARRRCAPPPTGTPPRRRGGSARRLVARAAAAGPGAALVGGPPAGLGLLVDGEGEHVGGPASPRNRSCSSAMVGSSTKSSDTSTSSLHTLRVEDVAGQRRPSGRCRPGGRTARRRRRRQRHRLTGRATCAGARPVRAGRGSSARS